jgi:ATP-binding cassette, subfamily B, multidrug efflux pump
MKPGFLIEDNVASELTFRRIFTRLWPYLKVYAKQLWFIVPLVLIYTIVGRSLPLIFGYAVDDGIKVGNWQVVKTIALIFLFLQISRGLMAYLQSLFIQRLGNRVLFDIREKLIRHVQHLSTSYFDKTSSGRLMTRVTNDVHSLGELFSFGFASIFISVIEIGSIVVTLISLSWPLTVVAILLLPVLAWITAKLSHIIRHRFGAAKRRLAMINSFTAESISGMKVMQLFDRTDESQKIFNRLSGEYKSLQLSTVRIFATLWPVIEAFNVGTIAATLLVGGAFREQLNLSAGQLAAFVLLIQSFFKPLRSILDKYNQLQNSLASADRVFQLLDVEIENQKGQFLNGRIRGKIQFRDVRLLYPGKATPALDQISLEIKPGESVALVGRTGSGKSSLISLVQRLYAPTEGHVLIDDLPIQSLQAQSLRSRIGVVQQDNFIFKGTIADNIGLMNPAISRERVARAAEQAHCGRLLVTHEGGLDARIEERGANLSMGERQLIAFARVLAFDPDILILDEATANIDSSHERLIQEATAQAINGRTSLIVAHRLSTILHCDRIVLLSDGRIIESGSHQVLMKLRGKYWELYNAQSLVEEEDQPKMSDAAPRLF